MSKASRLVEGRKYANLCYSYATKNNIFSDRCGLGRLSAAKVARLHPLSCGQGEMEQDLTFGPEAKWTGW